jgi:hypothetical protein
MSRKRSASETLVEPRPEADVYFSPPIHDRSSTFVAAFSHVLSHRALQDLPAFSDATHRIAAWRVPSKQRRIIPDGKLNYDLGHDDDGEAYAGKKVERVLESMSVEGSAVVARWYGGVLLGPVRFTHIESCVKRAVIIWQETSKAADSALDSNGDQKKRQKISEDDKTKAVAMCELLTERDDSIAVLRELLAEKTGKSTKKTAVQGTSSSKNGDNGPSEMERTTPVYASLPPETLMRLEDARDRTITFLLKQIDRAESESSKTNAGGSDEEVIDPLVDPAQEPSQKLSVVQEASSEPEPVK